MFRIGGDLFDVGVPYVAGIILFNVLYAIVNVVSRALGEHLNGAVRQVADITDELMAIGHPVSGKAKTNALDSAGENYVPGNHFSTGY